MQRDHQSYPFRSAAQQNILLTIAPAFEQGVVDQIEHEQEPALHNNRLPKPRQPGAVVGSVAASLQQVGAPGYVRYVEARIEQQDLLHALVLPNRLGECLVRVCLPRPQQACTRNTQVHQIPIDRHPVEVIGLIALPTGCCQTHGDIG